MTRRVVWSVAQQRNFVLFFTGMVENIAVRLGYFTALNEGFHKEKKTEGLLKMHRMASSITARGVDTTVGVGPKLGRFIAHKFAHERYTIAILARDLGRLSRFANEIAREEKA
ncbi:hypothetical protein V6N13_091033 [Hibiscus sabdariffa]